MLNALWRRLWRRGQSRSPVDHFRAGVGTFNGEGKPARDGEGVAVWLNGGIRGVRFADRQLTYAECAELAKNPDADIPGLSLTVGAGPQEQET